MSENFQLPDLKCGRRTPSGIIYDLEVTTEAKLITLEADQLGIKWEIVPFTNIVKLTYGEHSEYMRHGVTTTNRVPGPYICDDKYLTREVLENAGMPVSKGYCLVKTDSYEHRKEVFESLQLPLVVKPANGTHGNGVKLNVTTFDEMSKWLDYLFETEEKGTSTRRGAVMVEETARGEEYRIIATREKVIAVMSRRPASVMGDGINTVAQLIGIKNQEAIRNISQDLYPHIKVDDDVISVLQGQNLNLESIPSDKQMVKLRNVSNIMAGGDAVDMTDDCHETVKTIAVKIAQAMPSMTLVGIDFMTTDITADQSTQSYSVIEVNRSPEYAMHDIPMYGKKRGVAKEILLMMFPELKS